MTPADDTLDLRRRIIAACQDLCAAGLFKRAVGNLSVRTTGGLLVTPTAVPFDQVTPESLCPISVTAPPGDAAPLRPTSGWAIHQSVMRTRPDVAAVIYAQPPFTTAIAAQGRGLGAVHAMVADFGGDTVPVVDYAHFSSTALARDVTRALARRHGCLIANHGAIVVGATLDEAVTRLATLEDLARVDTYARIGGGVPQSLSDDAIAELQLTLADGQRN